MSAELLALVGLVLAMLAGLVARRPRAQASPAPPDELGSDSSRLERGLVDAELEQNLDEIAEAAAGEAPEEDAADLLNERGR